MNPSILQFSPLAINMIIFTKFNTPFTQITGVLLGLKFVFLESDYPSECIQYTKQPESSISYCEGSHSFYSLLKLLLVVSYRPVYYAVVNDTDDSPVQDSVQ